MSKLNKISKLVGLWYSCLKGHHKDRDCYFYLEICWSYDGRQICRVYHNGYIYDFEETTIDYDSGLDILINKITNQITVECQNQLEINEEERRNPNPNGWRDSEAPDELWNGILNELKKFETTQEYK